MAERCPGSGQTLLPFMASRKTATCDQCGASVSILETTDGQPALAMHAKLSDPPPTPPVLKVAMVAWRRYVTDDPTGLVDHWEFSVEYRDGWEPLYTLEAGS